MNRDQEIRQSMLHAAGRGISPVPQVSGAGLWDNIKGFAKHVYHFAAPLAQKHGRAIARDVVSSLGQKLDDSNKRIMEI
jgi:hypothetical protein